MNGSLAKLLAVVCLLALAVGFGVSASRTKRPPLDMDLHEAVGSVLAREISNQFGGRGSIVIVLPDADFKMPLVQAEHKAFRHALAEAGGVEILAEEKVRLEQMGPLDGLLTADRYFSLLDKYPSVAAIVSFVGLGEFTDADLARVGKGLPGMYLIAVNGGVPQKYYDRHLVYAAIEPRRTPVDLPADAMAPTDAMGRFELAFELSDGSRKGRP